MSKINNIIISAIAVLLSLTISLFAVDNIIVLPKTGHKKPKIKFNHLAHVEKYNAECIDCHHDGSNKKCSACHLKRDRGKIINLKGAFHQQCHDCHRKTSGPKACGRCHIGD